MVASSASAPRLERPRTLDELVALMRDAAGAHETVVVTGGDTAAEYGVSAASERARIDLKIVTRGLDRVVSYAPADLIIEVEAGMTVAAINELVARDGLRLALDPPEGAQATIGGAVACNAFGPLRARYGTLRDLVVGMSLVRADGTLVRGGGRVVKNVAGFDIPKLAIGSLGTLGAIATVTLRLHPLPTTSVALCADVSSIEAVMRLQFALENERLEPAATLATRANRWHYAIIFEGFPAGVAEQMSRATDVAERLAIHVQESDVAMELKADHDARNRSGILLQLSLPRATLGEVDELLSGFPDDPRTGEVTYPIVFPALGTCFIAMNEAFLAAGGGEPEHLLSLVRRVRERAERLGGHLTVIRDGPLRGRFDPFGAPPEAARLMRALRAKFDPERRLNPGRSPGGL